MKYLACLMLLASCATEPVPRQTISAEEAFATPKPQPLLPSKSSGRKPLGQVNVEAPKSMPKWAKTFRRPVDCAQGARDMEETYGHDTGWEALKACVGRGDFTLLPELLSWADDLRTRPEGAEQVARVIGARGGYLADTLPPVQAKGLPFIDLETALGAPGKHSGKFLLVVARASEVNGPRFKRLAVLRELAMVSGVAMEPTEHSTSYSGSSSYTPPPSGRGSRTSTRPYTPTTGPSVNLGGASQGAVNQLSETGKELQVHLTPQQDVALDSEFIFLLKIDGIAQEKHEELAEPVRRVEASLIGFYEVHPERF